MDPCTSRTSGDNIAIGFALEVARVALVFPCQALVATLEPLYQFASFSGSFRHELLTHVKSCGRPVVSSKGELSLVGMGWLVAAWLVANLLTCFR